MIFHKVHGAIVRTIYKVLAPKHPRGWLDFHVIANDGGKNAACVHCHGMEKWNLPNLEIADVPSDLLGYAHGIIFEIVGYMKKEKTINCDETIAGNFVSDSQIVPHQAVFRKVVRSMENGHEGLLRIVDIDETSYVGFPKRLFSAHLLSLSDEERNFEKKIWMLRKSTEIYPGDEKASEEVILNSWKNPNNYFTWEQLGCSLCGIGDFKAGIAAWEVAVKKWPIGAREFGTGILEAVKIGKIPNDEATQYWESLKFIA